MVFNFDVRAIWRSAPLFYVTILASLCIKELSRKQRDGGNKSTKQIETGVN